MPGKAKGPAFAGPSLIYYSNLDYGVFTLTIVGFGKPVAPL
jgi:hypothetical protein